MDSLAGHCPLVVHLCVRSGVVGSHCHCAHSWSVPWPRRAFSLSKGSFLRTGPWGRLSSEPLRDLSSRSDTPCYPFRLRSWGQPHPGVWSWCWQWAPSSVADRLRGFVVPEGYADTCAPRCFCSHTQAMPFSTGGLFLPLVSNPKT